VFLIITLYLSKYNLNIFPLCSFYQDEEQSTSTITFLILAFYYGVRIRSQFYYLE